VRGPTASSLAFAVLVLAPPAHAQLSGGVTVATDYRVRSVSMTDGRGAVSANVAYDHASGVYAGGEVVAHDPASKGVRVLGYQAYAGVAGRFASGRGWDVGVSHVDMAPYFDRRYGLEYTQAHVALTQGDVTGRLSVASGYPRRGVETAYLELNGVLRPTETWRLTGHLGLQTRLSQRRGDDERLDLTLGVVRSFGAAEAQLSWTVLTPRPEPRVSWTRPGVTAAVSVYF
jgi:uncharacterized protein (TIGR02001 family)